MTNEQRLSKKSLDGAKELKSLGSKKTTYQYTEPSKDGLETFPNPHPANSYEVVLATNEFTSLCPKTGQPDFASIEIRYIPNQRCVETKSLKLYLFAFRQYGAFMEDLTNKILNDLVSVLHPKEITITGSFASRGGITLNVTTKWSELDD